jgi:hypothetical protein
MIIDPDNPVVALCAAGMAVEGDADAAHELFEQAWAARRDDYDASIAAHFLARAQPTVATRLEWNAIAARHAEAAPDPRVNAFKASLYLNLGDAYLAAGEVTAAHDAAVRAMAGVADLDEDGYRTFVTRGIEGLQRRIAAASPVP